jgi:hypothetical protein
MFISSKNWAGDSKAQATKQTTEGNKKWYMSSMNFQFFYFLFCFALGLILLSLTPKCISTNVINFPKTPTLGQFPNHHQHDQ